MSAIPATPVMISSGSQPAGPLSPNGGCAAYSEIICEGIAYVRSHSCTDFSASENMNSAATSGSNSRPIITVIAPAECRINVPSASDSRPNMAR